MTFLLTLLAIAGGAVGQPASQSNDPQAVVSAFERQLHKWPKGMEKERDQATRAFFAGLKDSRTKIAAIGMTDSRFVYVIPRSLTSELMGMMLNDADLKVRLRAAHSLGYNGLGGEHYDGLVKLLKQADASQLDSVIYAMGHSRDKRFLPHLQKLLKHEDAGVRASTVFALRLWPNVSKEVLALWNDPHPQVRYNLLDFVNPNTDDGFAQLQERLKDKSAHVRVGAVERIGVSKNPKAAETVAGMLDDADPYVRGKAIGALGRLGARGYVDRVIRIFQDPKDDLYVRRMAVMTMPALGNAKHLAAVRAMENDPDSQIRDYAREAVKALERQSR